MGINFSDGFDSYSTTADLNNYKWYWASSAWSYSSGGGVTGLGAITATSTGGPATQAMSTWPTRYLFNNPGSNNSGSYCIGFWFKASGLPSTSNGAQSSGNILFQLINQAANQVTTGSTTLVCVAVMSSNGALISYAAGGSPQNSLINVCDGNFHWVESQIGAALGGSNAQALYIDGVLQFNANQAGNSYTVIGFSFYALPGTTITIDDLIIYSSMSQSVGAVYPTVGQYPLGQQVITTLRPTADSSVAFTPSSASASHAVLVNGVGKSTATFVQSNTLGADDLYTYAAMPYTPASINGVTLNSYVENPSFGSILFNEIGFESSLSFGSSLGSSIYTPGTPSLWQTTMFDSLTTSAWKSSTFNAATFGIRVSTASS